MNDTRQIHKDEQGAVLRLEAEVGHASLFQTEMALQGDYYCAPPFTDGLCLTHFKKAEDVPEHCIPFVELTLTNLTDRTVVIRKAPTICGQMRSAEGETISAVVMQDPNEAHFFSLAPFTKKSLLLADERSIAAMGAFRTPEGYVEIDTDHGTMTFPLSEQTQATAYVRSVVGKDDETLYRHYKTCFFS